MKPHAREVYVPAGGPDPAAGGEDEGRVWPRPVFTPGSRGTSRPLSARVRRALGPGPRGREGADPGDAARTLFRSPDVAREVVERLSREALDHGCTAVAAVEPGGGLLAAPVAVEAGLPLVPADRTENRSGRAADARPGGGPAGEGRGDGAPRGDGDRVLLVDVVADSGERMARAAGRVEAAGGRVAAAAVVVELSGGGARDRMDDYNFMSILTLE